MLKIYIPEKDCCAILEISDGKGGDIATEFLLGVKNSGLYKAPPEIRERWAVEYMMYRDDYNEWADIVDMLCVIIHRVVERGEESPIVYEKIITPAFALESV